MRPQCYVLHMLDMARDPAVWRKKMTPAEARELDLAKQARDASNESYKAVYRRLKNRCIQRLISEDRTND